MSEPARFWQKLAAGAVAAAALAALIIFRSRIGADFWPLDSSRIGPNLLASLAQWALVFIAAVLLWPPWRRRLHRFVDSKLAPLHRSHKLVGQSVRELHEKLEAIHDSHAELHRKLDALTPEPKEPSP